MLAQVHAMARRYAARVRQSWVLAGRCPCCGGPLLTPRLHRNLESRAPKRAQVLVCTECIQRALVRMAIALNYHEILH
jgi:hypothetical protein